MKAYYKITVSEIIKTIDNKIDQHKAQYNLDWQTAMISVLSSGNIGKYKFLTGKDVLPEKAVTIKRFEYSQLGSQLKKQTSNIVISRIRQSFYF